jgi:7-keto-8-aminopelargonate synthetase-like enzyme
MENLPRHLQYVNDTFNTAKELGIIHLKAQKDEKTNRFINIDEKPMINFMSNNYMGFEDDIRVKNAAIEAIEKFGIFTSISRTYLSFDHYLELEDKLEKIFGLPTFLANTTTLGHFAYLPLIIGKNDAIIMDQFVHQSVQMCVQYLKGGGIYSEMIRHNQMDELEKRIKVLSENHNKVWYLTDGVFQCTAM